MANKNICLLSPENPLSSPQSIDQAGGAVADSFRIKYARWEEKQNEIKRARSVFERALDLDYKNPKVWSVYFDMEIRHRNVNHARYATHKKS